MVHQLIILSLLVVGVAIAASGQEQFEKLVRVSLSKKTSEQSGELGQPLTSYYTHVDVGTPPKTFRMLIDINAREIWLPHYLTFGLFFSRLNYKTGYAKKFSTTATKEAETYEIGYEGTVLEGKAYRDLFELKNVSESLEPVKYEQRFLAISSASNDKFTGRFEGVDGVLALDLWPITETGSDMTAVSLTRARLTNKLKFALSLDADSAGESGGELVIGGSNPTLYSGPLRYHKVVSQYSWELGLQGVMLGAHLIGDCHVRARAGSDDDACTALLTTTRNDVRGPTETIQAIYRLLGLKEAGQDVADFKSNSLQEIDCLRVAKAPVISFVIDGVPYLLPPTSYIRKKVDGLIFKKETCYVALLANGSANKWELGTNFLTNYYTVFEQDSRQIGFAEKK